jgi:hypothetical protein
MNKKKAINAILGLLYAKLGALTSLPPTTLKENKLN